MTEPQGVTPMSIAEVPSTIGKRLQPSFAVQNDTGYEASNDACYEGMLTFLGFTVGTLGSLPGCCCFPNPFIEVHQGTVGLVTKFGRFVRAVDPGLHKINPFCESIKAVDIRMQVEDIPRQVVLTKDNVSINIESALYWNIVDPFTAMFLVENVQKALVERTMTTLRMIMGNRSLQDAIEHREQVVIEVRDIIDSVAESWGVNVESILMKDLILPADLLTTMSSAATQKRLGESKVISAQAEVNSAKLMREAADILNHPAAMQIRYLETLQAISSNAGSKTIFLPTVQTAVGAVPGGDKKN